VAMEAIDDITASAEVSQLPVHGEEFDSRIQGGLLVSTPVRFTGTFTNVVISPMVWVDSSRRFSRSPHCPYSLRCVLALKFCPRAV